MVVREPQKPTAINNEYFVSRLSVTYNEENTPRMKLPIMFTNNTLRVVFQGSDRSG